MYHLSISLSSLLMIHSSQVSSHVYSETNLDYDFTDSDIHMILPIFPDRKAHVKCTRTSSLAVWPSPPSTQVMRSRSSIRILPWMMTRRSSIWVTVSPINRKPRTTTPSNSVLLTVFEFTVFHVSHWLFCSSEWKQRKYAIAKPLQHRERDRRKRRFDSASLIVMSKTSLIVMSKKGQRNGISVILKNLKVSENSSLMDVISGNIFNEELNKLLEAENSIQRKVYIKMSPGWRTRIWNEDIQNVHGLSWVTAWAWISKTTISWKSIRSRKLCRKFPRNWKIEKTLLRRKKSWQNNEDGRISDVAWSGGITNSESIILRSWFAEQFWQCPRFTSNLHFFEFEKVWQRSWNATKYTRGKRKVGAENHCNQDLFLAFKEEQDKKIWTVESVQCLWLTMLRVLILVFEVILQFRVISLRRCFCKKSLTK